MLKDMSQPIYDFVKKNMVTRIFEFHRICSLTFLDPTLSSFS